MVTFFIADIHLEIKKPKICARFLHFLSTEAATADALYILGDLFEMWIGDDDPNFLHQNIALAIKKLVNSGVQCFFIHGNRDFLIGKYFASKSGIILLPEETVLNLYGHKILIMHGDNLCTNDSKYLAFRYYTYKSWVKKLFLALPIFIRSYIVSIMRVSSKMLTNNKIENIMDVNQQAVIEIIKKYNVNWLIHGHTHRENTHIFTAYGKRVSRIVLGAWHSYGSMVKVTPQNIELIRFQL